MGVASDSEAIVIRQVIVRVMMIVLVRLSVVTVTGIPLLVLQGARGCCAG